ncbi:TPA: ssrAB-activated protein [Kluyvera ascorbata]|uniref:SsrAB-activated protein n=1 Tax=Kluyvera genomosp. 2 TaxID=2774054 RepID=A0A2T2Y2E5_9ENTR|nr:MULTISPECIES: SrfA family protein [Enterobacteriaceae]HAT3918407.1 ssrAB-activated protein [Kluyvera ascorbata]PSR46714.1 ssrAB-activated protein [Kluyvera genomosp. 2]BBQ83738.1 ssrAB activated protein [Klebsiella sp. WP3-W18-ESBL-02]BBR20758.1 ssrAB activated protein [Klebsiella sp. WP3-S18-ESBL-05]HAT3943320.1 ssrAB-activated protein [Kluyvera ascorbata]
MAKTLLRSGSLDDFQAVGGGGQTVFHSALQVRETLRLRKQNALVDCLAIPQLNDEGDRVDWYSPVDGTPMGWKAANESQRTRALHYLEGLQDSARTLSKKCLQSEKTAQQLFGALLEKTLQFPGENHLFLVDGKPVISFWGFVNLNEGAREDVFDCLRYVEPEPPEAPLIVELPEIIEEPEPVIATFSEADAPLISPNEPRLDAYTLPENEPEEQTRPAEPAEPVAMVMTPPRRPRWLWALPLAAAIAAVAIALPLMIPSTQAEAEPEPVAKDIAPPLRAAAPAMPTLTDGLPLHQASVKTTPDVKEDEKEKPLVIAAIPKDALVMDADQMRAGTTRFLNGSWRAQMDISDAHTGKAPNLRYQIQNNKGTARLLRDGNIVCKAAVFSGLHQNGELMIKSRGNAQCSDGARYPLPEISCKPGNSNVAVCSARFDAKTVVALTFKKTGA